MGKIIKIEKIDNEKWDYFVEECKAIVIETAYISRSELIRGKWELGKKIAEEEKNFERRAYGDKTIKTLSTELGISGSHIYKMVQFYKKFPFESFREVLSQMPEGKNLTWYKLCQNYLPKPREEDEEEESIEEKQANCKHLKLKCINCGKIIDRTLDNF